MRARKERLGIPQACLKARMRRMSFQFANTWYIPSNMKPLARAILALAALTLGVAGLGSAAQAVELLVVGQRNCAACKAWEMDVGSVYARTDEGERAPLRRIRIEDLSGAGFRFRSPVVAAPTFVLLDGKAEIGRITGYSDAAAFWGSLNALLRKVRPDYPPQETRTVTLRRAIAGG